MSKKLSKGFTLVELLVVIAIIGILAVALFPAISGAMKQAKYTACTKQGETLWKAITQAGLKSPDRDMWALWPRTPSNKGTDEEDITGKVFGTSTDYFKELFDLQNNGKENQESYLEGMADVSCLYGSGVPSFQGGNIQPRNIMWVVAQGVSDDINESVPILITRNAAVDSLPTTGSFNGTEKTKVGIGKENGGESSTPFGKEGFVLVRRGGQSAVVETRYAKLYNVYDGKSFTISSTDFKYLKTGASN